LYAIQNQSEFYFLYNSELIDVAKKVDIAIEEEKVDAILTRLFDKNEVDFLIKDRYIVLTPVGGNAELFADQQQPAVSGTVTDESGEPLPGVTVVVKGTTRGTVTNADGEYQLIDIPEDATLVFSFVGMRTQEVEARGQTSIDVTMEEDVIGIEEVVAIGYGTMKKSDLTGSIATLRGDDLAERRTLKASEALQGAIPGVTVSRSGAPGASATIRIRGITTIGNSTPLTIIDGVPGNIDDINPDDIENISVLKDAASASIYGSRAASGVILITTKRSKLGQLKITYNTEYGVGLPTKLPKYMGPEQLMKIRNEWTWNDNDHQGSEYPTYSKELIDNYAALHAENPDLYPSTDWQELMLNDYAPRQRHVLKFTAGTKNIGTLISVAYDKENALYDHRTYSRYTIRANNDITINDYWSADVDLHFTQNIDKRPVIDIPIWLGYGSVLDPAIWTNGLIARGDLVNWNPYAQLHYGGFNNSWDDVLGGKISIDFTPIEELKIQAIVAPNKNVKKGKNFQKEILFTDWDNPDLYIGHIQGAEETKLSESRNDSYNITSQLLANYSKIVRGHDFNLMAGFENYYYFKEYLGASRDQYALKNFPYLNLGNENYMNNSGYAIENAYRSFFGRAMYNYKNRYLIQLNARYDGSSRFHEDYRWGLFPSVSLGWVISEESFIPDNTALSFLKLRASWGNLGNERIGNYPYQSSLEFRNDLLYQGQNRVSALSAMIRKYPIKNITWETTETYNVGLDVNFFDNKLILTGDYYKKTTKDMLLALEIPDFMGFSNPDQNTGKMFTKGWDIALGYQNKIGNVNFSVSMNLSDFKSVMGDLGGTELLGNQVKIEGSEFNEWYGYKSDGLFQTQEEIDNSAVLNELTRPGDIKYVDISGPDGVPDGKITPEYDRVLLGGSLPRYLYGGNIQLGFRNFDFSVVFQGIGKQNTKMERRMIGLVGAEGNYDLVESVLGKYWSKYNSDEENLNAKYPRYTRTAQTNNMANSDFWLFNGGYFRLKNIMLSYSVPESIIKNFRLQGLRVYSSISDLFSIDRYPQGWDPETSSNDYWITSSFNIGLSVDF
jgi:TonB-linked SusC/RagA family outer membrane protein